jgi:hypothetical protein
MSNKFIGKEGIGGQMYARLSGRHATQTVNLTWKHDLLFWHVSCHPKSGIPSHQICVRHSDDSTCYAPYCTVNRTLMVPELKWPAARQARRSALSPISSRTPSSSLFFAAQCSSRGSCGLNREDSRMSNGHGRKVVPLAILPAKGRRQICTVSGFHLATDHGCIIAAP